MDGAVEPAPGEPYERDIERRLSRVENDVRDLKDTLAELKMMVARIEAQIPYLATKAEIAGLESKIERKLANMPSKTYMWGILGVRLTAYACGLAALAILQ